MSVYKSPYADLQVLIRPEAIHYHPATGVELSRTKHLRANFGTHGGEFTSTNELTGELETHAIIHGHYFDTEAAAEVLNWTPEELESVEAALDKLVRTQPYLIGKVDMEMPSSAPPWPTYDKTPLKNVATLAISLGLVREALRYERENEKRESVIAEFEDWVSDQEPEVVEAPAPPKQDLTLNQKMISLS